MQKGSCKNYNKDRTKDLREVSKDSQETKKKCQQLDKQFVGTMFRKVKRWLDDNLDKDLEEYYEYIYQCNAE